MNFEMPDPETLTALFAERATLTPDDVDAVLDWWERLLPGAGLADIKRSLESNCSRAEIAKRILDFWDRAVLAEVPASGQA